MTIAATIPHPAPGTYPRLLEVRPTDYGYWRVRTEAIEEEFIAFADASVLFSELVDPRLVREPTQFLARC